MHCTTTSHVWLWTGSGTSEGIPDHLPCQCHRYTAGEWYSLRAENARLTAQLAERDAEVARLVASWQRAGDLLPYTLHRSECFQYVKGPGYCSCGLLDVIRDYGRAALAARGD